MGMRLFAWQSDYLKGYRQGLLAVEAHDVDHARRKLMLVFEADVRERFYLPEDCQSDDYWREEYEQHKAKFEADIAKPPRTPGVILMYGGD